VAVAFISVVSGVLWHFPVFRVCVAVGGLVRGQRLLLLFDECAITCGCSFYCAWCLGRPDQFSECFSVFSCPPLPFVFVTLLLLLLLLLLIITVIIISTELLALCDGCLGWGWVWLAGLVPGCG